MLILKVIYIHVYTTCISPWFIAIWQKTKYIFSLLEDRFGLISLGSEVSIFGFLSLTKYNEGEGNSFVVLTGLTNLFAESLVQYDKLSLGLFLKIDGISVANCSVGCSK